MCFKSKKNLKEDAESIRDVIGRAFKMAEGKRIGYDIEIESIEKLLEKMKKEIEEKKDVIPEIRLESMMDTYDMKEQEYNDLLMMREPFLNLSNEFYKIKYLADYCYRLGAYDVLVKMIDKKTRKKFENLLTGMDDITDRTLIFGSIELVRKKVEGVILSLKRERAYSDRNFEGMVANAASERAKEIGKKSAKERFDEKFGSKEKSDNNSNNNAKQDSNIANKPFVMPITHEDNNNSNNANNSRKINN